MKKATVSGHTLKLEGSVNKRSYGEWLDPIPRKKFKIAKNCKYYKTGIFSLYDATQFKGKISRAQFVKKLKKANKKRSPYKVYKYELHFKTKNGKICKIAVSTNK